MLLVLNKKHDLSGTLVLNMSSKIIYSENYNLTAVNSSITNIPLEDLILIQNQINPPRLQIKQMLTESISRLKIFDFELYLVISDKIYKYQEKPPGKSKSQSPDRKVLIGEVKPNYIDICFFTARVYVLYAQRIQIYNTNPWELIHDIITNTKLTSIISNTKEVYVTGDKKLFKVGEGFLIELFNSSENLVSITPTKGNFDYFTIQYEYFVGVYRISTQNLEFQLRDECKVDRVFHLNEKMLVVYNRENKLLKVYHWEVGTDTIFEMYIEDRFEVYIEDEVIYLYNTESGNIIVVFYEAERDEFKQVSLQIGIEIKDIIFIKHENTLVLEDNHGENIHGGNGFIEILVGCQDFLGIFSLKVDFSRDLGMFYSQTNNTSQNCIVPSRFTEQQARVRIPSEIGKMPSEINRLLDNQSLLSAFGQFKFPSYPNNPQQTQPKIFSSIESLISQEKSFTLNLETLLISLNNHSRPI